jgi:hypothetical protein
MDSLPVELYRYIIGFAGETGKVAARFVCRSWRIGLRGEGRNYGGACQEAAWLKNLTLLRWLIEEAHCYWNVSTINVAIMEEQLDAVRYLFNLEAIGPYSFIEAAAKYGKVSVLNLLEECYRANGWNIESFKDFSIFKKACKHNHIDLVLWCLNRNMEIKDSLINIVLENGFVELYNLLKPLFKCGGDEEWNINRFYMNARPMTTKKTIDFYFSLGVRPDRIRIDRILDLEVLKYAHSLGVTGAPSLAFEVAYRGDLTALKWAIEKNYPVSYGTLRGALLSGNLEMVKYILPLCLEYWPLTSGWNFPVNAVAILDYLMSCKLFKNGFNPEGTIFTDALQRGELVSAEWLLTHFPKMSEITEFRGVVITTMEMLEFLEKHDLFGKITNLQVHEPSPAWWLVQRKIPFLYISLFTEVLDLNLIKLLIKEQVVNYRQLNDLCRSAVVRGDLRAVKFFQNLTSDLKIEYKLHTYYNINVFEAIKTGIIPDLK